MKILFICHRLPFPPTRGGKIRPFNMIRWLSSRHEVTVVSVARTQEELEAGRGLARHCHRYEAGLISPQQAWLRAGVSLLSGKPASLGYFRVPELHARAREISARTSFDLIWVHCSSAAQYVPDPATCPVVMDFGDMDSEKWHQYSRHRAFPMSLIYRLEGLTLRRYEKELARKHAYFTVISPGEKRILDSYGLGLPVTVIPNGVDLDFFTNKQDSYDSRTIVFIGRMDYYPNIQAAQHFCAEIFPFIRREIPDARFTIVGSNPNRRVQTLGKLPGVSVTGSVGDVRPYLQNAAVSVAPLRIAFGIQNKVLESMAMRVPVVASPGAFEGIDAVAGEHLLVGDSPMSFAEHVLSLMRDSNRRRRFAEAGRQRIEERHTWKVCLERLDRVIEGITTRPCMARA